MADRKTLNSNAVSAPLVSLGTGSALAAFANAESPSAVIRTSKALGFKWGFWQSWDPDAVLTWDAMPIGFLEHYYGIQADRFCPVAVAIRRRWQNFTFSEARTTLNGPYAGDATKVWEAFGVRDGAVIFGGRGQNVSALILTADRSVDSLFMRYRAELSIAAVRMDELLRGHPGLTRTARDFINLSDKQLEVLRIQVDHPELSFQEQAKLLDISPRMLEKRHQQIAKRFGVSSFTAAVAKAVADGIGLG